MCNVFEWLNSEYGLQLNVPEKLCLIESLKYSLSAIYTTLPKVNLEWRMRKY